MKNENWKSRTHLLLGDDNLSRLHNTHVLVAGLGGVGGYAAEQLCRAGIGKFTLADHDIVQASNRNRQIIALVSSEGKRKIDLFSERMKEINPDAEVTVFDNYLDPANIPDLLCTPFDYVLDAIDTLTPKVALLTEAVKRGFFVISSMGSGGKTDPSQVRVCDISKSYGCRFAYKVRKALHANQIRTGLRVVFSPEPVPEEAILVTDGSENKRSVVGTVSYMPAIFGCFCAAEIIQDVIRKEKPEPE
jgi:tRNA threonylcarbamoyladenosine dehydratase